MTTEPTAPAPPTRSRRLILLGIVLAVIAAGGLLVWRSFPALTYPSYQLVTWELSGPGETRLDSATAQTATALTVGVWLNGAPSLPLDASYLEPHVIYTPWAVIITLRDPHVVECKTPPCVGGYTTTIPYPVQLSEPLGGRALFDGSAFPPEARPYP